MSRVIVGRVAADVALVAQHLGYEVVKTFSDGNAVLRVDGIPVIESATPDHVRDKVVYGNLPLPLACLAREVWVVEFEGTPPRGQEYTLADMLDAGASLRPYVVRAGTREQDTARAC